jgi:hypothetical protein
MARCILICFSHPVCPPLCHMTACPHPRTPWPAGLIVALQWHLVSFSCSTGVRWHQMWLDTSKSCDLYGCTLQKLCSSFANIFLWYTGCYAQSVMANIQVCTAGVWFICWKIYLMHLVMWLCALHCLYGDTLFSITPLISFFTFLLCMWFGDIPCNFLFRLFLYICSNHAYRKGDLEILFS